MRKQKIKCEICGKEFLHITYLHLKKHKINLLKYKKMFPNVKTYSNYIKMKRSFAGKIGIKIRENRRKEDNKYAKKLSENSRKVCLQNNSSKLMNDKIKILRKDPKFEKKFIENRRKNGYKTSKIIKKKRQKDPKFEKKYLNHLKNICSICGFEAIKQLREKKPYWFYKIPFSSNSEMKCAKLFYKYFSIIPKENKNCHIKLKKGEIDFLILNKFIEFHPCKTIYDKRNINQYYKDRRQILDNNGHKDKELLVFEKVKDVENFCKDVHLEQKH